MKRLAVALLFFLAANSLLAQNQGNFWYFGDQAGLDFNSGSPVFVSGGQVFFPDGSHSEGSASICDSSGSLLFYTNGNRVWNKNHVQMQGGSGLFGNWSSTQSSLIVPQPGSSRYYYIFTTDGFYNAFLDKGLRYTMIDMCLDNGNGGVVWNEKNILLVDTVAEKLTAVRHENGTDYWIITHKYYSDAFYSLHLTSTGIVDTVISHIGSFHPTGAQYPVAAIGQLKASPDGHKLAIANGNSNNCIAEYFDFDPLTGVVSNHVNVQWDTLNQFYGISFSPDNSKLYFACNAYAHGIYQFDLTAGGGDPDSVRASRTLVTDTNFAFLALQLGPDGKIYSTRTPQFNSYMGVINYPNASGIACNYVDSAISLNGHSASYGLPNFIDSYDYSNSIPGCLTDIGEQSNEDRPSAFPNPFLDQTTIRFDHSVAMGTVVLRNALGQTVKLYENVTGKSFVLLRGDLPSGYYTLQLVEENNVTFAVSLIVAEPE